MKLENNIEREITSEEIYRAMGISVEAIEKIEEVFLKVREFFKKLVERLIETFKRVWIKIKEQIDIDKFINLIKYKKYQKRVRNRNKLYIKRKQKYGKGKRKRHE
ncbi:hypothetical protein [uncultured Clostridium sp.]|jgi:hypothetical protein|uniref:hypothetical protein n=1 Tax=uncultured Clostridium sp. TaxID=59620 RepID=UPI0025DE7AE5|nr:hypothetical protein [uncultured Clostridium sp.]